MKRLLGSVFTLLLCVGLFSAVASAEEIKEYKLYVSGVQITSENKDDVLGDGTVSFNPEANVLTLNGYDSGTDPAQSEVSNSFLGYVSNATIVSGIDALQINVTKDSVINGNGNNDHDSAVALMKGENHINISEGATLTLNGSTTGSQLSSYQTMYIHDMLLVKGSGNLVVNGPVTASGRAIGIYGTTSISEDVNATLIAGTCTTTPYSAWAVDGILAVTGGRVVAKGAPAVSLLLYAEDGWVIRQGDNESNLTKEFGAPSSIKSYVEVYPAQSHTVTVENGYGSGEYKEGAKVYVRPKEGKEVESYTATSDNGETVYVSKKEDSSYYVFRQTDGNVTFTFKYRIVNPFTDVTKDDYFYDAVLWAVDEGITTGTTDTTFSPQNNCTRAQMVTFLWRAAGKPEPVTTENPFEDVAEDAYYYKAVLWAVENYITKGTREGQFSPNEIVNRAQACTFLYRLSGETATGDMPFADVEVGSYYEDAVRWAYQNGVTTGTSETTFSPDAPCQRGQIVTFLYRFYVK